ncbi:FHA domain-containing protein, partial [Mycobacterium tuberculosis]
ASGGPGGRGGPGGPLAGPPGSPGGSLPRAGALASSPRLRCLPSCSASAPAGSAGPRRVGRPPRACPPAPPA